MKQKRSDMRVSQSEERPGRGSRTGSGAQHDEQTAPHLEALLDVLAEHLVEQFLDEVGERTIGTDQALEEASRMIGAER